VTQPDASDGFSYDVAFSFAGEDRDYVERVAKAVEGKVRLFYDRYEQTDLWGKNFYTHLAEVYGQKSRFCVMFMSKHYASKLWTNHERESAQARAFSDHETYILPARFDDTAIPGVLPTVGYVDLRSMTPEDFGKLILEKITSAGARKRPLPHQSPPRRRRWLVTAPAVLVLAVAAYVLLPRNPTLTLDLAKEGLINVEDRSVTLWIDYTMTGGEPDDQPSVQVAGEEDPSFTGQPLHVDRVDRASVHPWPVVFRLAASYPGGPRWSGWVRLVAKRQGKVVATSDPRHVEIGRGAGTAPR